MAQPLVWQLATQIKSMNAIWDAVYSRAGLEFSEWLFNLMPRCCCTCLSAWVKPSKKNDIKMEVLFWVALVIAIQVRWSIILKLPKQITVHFGILNTHQASDLLQPPLAFAELISEYALAPLYFISVFHFHDDFRADSNSRDEHGWMDGFFVVENAVCTLRVMLFVTMHCWASYIADKMIIW